MRGEQTMKILVYGSMNIDNVYKLDYFVTPGESLISDNLQKFCGGKGLNQAVACSY